MSDLISREALIKELNELWRYVNFDGDKDVFDIITKAKSIEQGEPVGWLNNVGFYINNGIKQSRVLRGEPDANDFNIPVYTTPQQPQSVGEAVIDKAAYDGAREDLSIWKRRALEAEEKVRKYDQRIVDIGVIAMTPVTTPQQAQSVADALEEAAKICDELAEQDYCVDVRVASEAIRALIKRNAEGG